MTLQPAGGTALASGQIGRQIIPQRHWDQREHRLPKPLEKGHGQVSALALQCLPHSLRVIGRQPR